MRSETWALSQTGREETAVPSNTKGRCRRVDPGA